MRHVTQLCGTVLHCTALCCIFFCDVLQCIDLYCTVLHCVALYCTVLHCVALYCTELLFTYTPLHCTIALHCTVRCTDAAVLDAKHTVCSAVAEGASVVGPVDRTSLPLVLMAHQFDRCGGEAMLVSWGHGGVVVRPWPCWCGGETMAMLVWW